MKIALIGTLPVVLHNSEAMPGLGYKKLGAAYQQKLYLGPAKKIIDITKSKTCNTCQTSKLLSEYRPHPTSKDWTRNKCIPCEKLQADKKAL